MNTSPIWPGFATTFHPPLIPLFTMSCRPSIVPPFVKHFVAFSQETASRTTSPYIKAQLGVTKANFLVTDKCKEIDALPCPWRKKHQCSLSLTMLWYWFCSLITHSGVKIRQKVSFSYFANEANYFFGTWKFIKFIKFDYFGKIVMRLLSTIFTLG